MPGIEYLYSMHPEFDPALDATEAFSFGTSLFFHLLPGMAEWPGYFPPMSEIYHYPYLCAGWFGMFITAINLMPVGQLDGGHILYALAGSRTQTAAAKAFFALLVTIGILGFMPFVPSHLQIGTTGWLLWAVIIFFIIKIRHPDVQDDTELQSGRKWLGWATMALFVLIFPPVPFTGFLALLI
jgi:Zn-dependent protease